MKEMEETLLQKAKKKKIHRGRWFELSKQEMELALAWARDEVGYAAVQEVLTGNKCGGAGVYYFLAAALKQHIKKSLPRK